MTEDYTHSDTEIALVDSIKTILEIMMTQNIVGPVALDKMFASQHQYYTDEKMLAAASIMRRLRRFVSDPQQKAHRENLRILLQEEPEGQA
jgi:hypothetical protein